MSLFSKKSIEDGSEPLWQGSLLPLGCVAAVKGACFAVQREQAPSPQKAVFVKEGSVADRQDARLIRTHEHIEIPHLVLLQLGLLDQ